MQIAIVGATGRIGSPLVRVLLDQGHHVRALSRSEKKLAALAQEGAEPFVGSFDEGTGDLKRFFADMDSAFLMVKTDWNNIDDHYGAVAARMVDSLDGSSVKHVVNLSAMGAEVPGRTGHFEVFRQLEQSLDQLARIDITHLRAAWFMENTFAWASSVAKYGRLAWFYEPDRKMPWVAIDDIAAQAAKELRAPATGHRLVRELGSQDLSMRDIAAVMSRSVDRPVSYRQIDRTDSDVEQAFLDRFGTPAQWQDDDRTADVMNRGLIGLQGDAETRPSMPTTMEVFIDTRWRSEYRKALTQDQVPETFLSWGAR